MTFFRNYFTIMGVKKGYEYGDRVLAKKPRIGTLPVPNTFFKKNLTKNASWGTIDNCTLDRKDRETQQDFQDVFTINNNVYTSGLAQPIVLYTHRYTTRTPNPNFRACSEDIYLYR